MSADESHDKITIDPALERGRCGVVTGAASGIGLAIAGRLAAPGLKVAMVDLPTAGLGEARETLITGGARTDDIMALPGDVSDPDRSFGLADRGSGEIGNVHALHANARIQPGSSIFDEDGNWERSLRKDLMGIKRSVQMFAPKTIADGEPGLVVTMGLKQGITSPPGDPGCNVSKADAKVVTEALRHDLRIRRNCRVEARLFGTGFAFTANGRAEKPDAAWTPEQVVDFLFAALTSPGFYIRCPDGDVDRSMDERRIRWAACDIAVNRPPLSRWHSGYAGACNGG